MDAPQNDSNSESQENSFEGYQTLPVLGDTTKVIAYKT